jgi:hypothetical protein
MAKSPRLGGGAPVRIRGARAAPHKTAPPRNTERQATLADNDTPEDGRLNFKGDIRSTVTPRIYDTTDGPMFPASASYDPETDTTTLHLVKRFVR